MRAWKRSRSTGTFEQESSTQAGSPPHKFGAYLARILTNTFVSGYRRTRVASRVCERADLREHLVAPARIDEAQNPESTWHAAWLSDDVLEALTQLPASYREVVQCVDITGHSYKETAEMLGVPLGTVMSRLHRARSQMRAPLRRLAREYGIEAAA